MTRTPTTGTQSLGPDWVGGFVHTPTQGIGRLVALDSGTANVRYFQSPGRQPYVDRQHHLVDVAPTSLPTHTRAYVYDGRRWRIGRIDGQHPQDQDRYLVAFPNSEGAVLTVDAFDVRWNERITNPFDVLEAVGGDSPVVYESRLGILGAWGRQCAAAAGVEGLLLASVELHRHQLRVIRRVTADPIKRYLLADEVGLGKTIEAGALIWQFLAERPTARVLIVAPDHLREQWGTELLERFRTGEYTHAWLRIRSHENESSWPTEPVDFLVVDEAHHFTRTGNLPESTRARITDIAHSAEALLLLSATPVRSNEAGFLDLLHLIDPAHYRADQLEDFVRRVELRDQIALTYQALVPTLDAFDLSLYAHELKAHFPSDPTLSELLDAALSAGDDQRPDLISRLREHLSETYRLHHRLLRTRRTADIGSTFSVRGRQRAVPFTLEVSDPSDTLRREFLDSVRAELTAALESGLCTSDDAIRALRDVAGRCSSLSHAVLPLHGGANRTEAMALLEGLVDQNVRMSWDALIEDIHASHTSVLYELGDVLSRTTVARGLERVVLASAYTDTARVVAQELARRWGEDRVSVHLSDSTDADNSSALRRWREPGPCSLLVCDAGAEEGLNLQDAGLLVHLDLPWESFRVEQRIGRCDRHGRPESGPIPSAVVVHGDQPYALGWFEFLADGCGVFNSSVSSLQYVLSDTERQLQAEVLHRGPSAMSDAIDEQVELLAQERTRITAHDALDAIDEAPGSEDADTALIDGDGDQQLTAATVTWLEGVGAGIRRPAPGTIRIARRPRPQVPFDVQLAMAPYVETEIALDRSAAVTRALPILRAGHPLIDVLAEHLRTTDRGVAFAMFRPARGQWPPVVFLRTDFLVSLRADAALAERAATLGLSEWLMQTTAELAPPGVETVIAMPDGSEVTHPSLRQPYNKQRGDRNLSSRPELFDRLTEHLDWPKTCETALLRSEGKLAERSSVVERCEVTGVAVARRVRQIAERERAREGVGLERDDRRWDELAEMPVKALEAHAEVIGCGAIFIGDPQEFDRRA
jgi:ATP-dependent helicase HepA